jgi:hypothetical protein
MQLLWVLPAAQMQQKQSEPAYINQLDNYIVRLPVVLPQPANVWLSPPPPLPLQEDLYDEDMTKKVRATGLVAQLFRQTEHFESLLAHESLLQTLARIMREEMKRSIDLCINIISVFFSVSNFSQFHQLIMDNQVCGLRLAPAGLQHALAPNAAPWHWRHRSAPSPWT